MLRIGILLLASCILGELASVSPIVDFQEQFSALSRGIEPQLRDFRVENNQARSSQLIHRMLDGLGNVTVEMRDISWDYWARIEAHELATPECLERIRPSFDYYVLFGGWDIQYQAEEMDQYMRLDAIQRFNPVASYAQRENSRAIYQTVQTLGRNQFLDNMGDAVVELQDELEYYENLWGGFQEWLRQEIADIADLVDHVEYRIDYWYEFTVRWHHVFMGLVLDSVEDECYPDSRTRSWKPLVVDQMKAKRMEFQQRMMVRYEV